MNDLSATQRCVKCGLCLPHCPTFNLTGNEADSPRGRISLMQLLDQPDPELSPGVFKHLDQCLLCHACEAMCPSQVPFDRLMDTARERLEAHRHRSLPQRLLQAFGLELLASRGGRRFSAALLGSVRLFGLYRLTELRGVPAGFKRLLHLLPTRCSNSLKTRDAGHSQIRKPGCVRFADGATPAEAGTVAAVRGKVQLFTGCTGALFDDDTLQASRRLLQRLGYQVSIPSGQGCCGALHQHSGRPAKARQLAEANLDAFAGDKQAVLSFATGCTAHLLGYRTRYPQAAGFTQRVSDIIDYLAADAASALRFRPLPETVALYIPCTQRNVLKQQDTLIKILARVPQLQTIMVNPDGGCCGAAGSYMLTQAALSDRLGDAVAERVINSGARVLLTTNIGCSLQLGAGLKRRGADIAVMHPVVLLESLLVSAGCP